MELLLWLTEIEIWRLQREQTPVKQEDHGQSPDDTTIVSYPKGDTNAHYHHPDCGHRCCTRYRLPHRRMHASQKTA